MSAITLGPSGLPVQLTPVLTPATPTSLLQPPTPQPPTAIPSVERQANGGATRSDLGRREAGGGSPPSGGRGRTVDLTV